MEKYSAYIYQARNGAIMLGMGSRHAVLTEEQIQNLMVDIYALDDFSLTDYQQYYGRIKGKEVSSAMTEAEKLRGENGLPDICYVVHPDTGELVSIRRGANDYSSDWKDSREMNQDIADFLNQSMGINLAQIEAMQAGLKHGWNAPEADPEHYPELLPPSGSGLYFG